jgi:hypothetical protein
VLPFVWFGADTDVGGRVVGGGRVVETDGRFGRAPG